VTAVLQPRQPATVQQQVDSKTALPDVADAAEAGVTAATIARAIAQAPTMPDEV